MFTQQQASLRRGALLFALLMLFADVSSGVLATSVEARSNAAVSQYEEPILIDGLPPLMCGDDLCERPARTIDRAGRASAEPHQWWLTYGPDLDWNGMDDRLQRVLDGQESVSPTAIMGPDGRKTVAIIVDYAWAPNDAEVNTLKALLNGHGWVGEEGGAWFQVMNSIDSVVVDKVPVERPHGHLRPSRRCGYRNAKRDGALQRRGFGSITGHAFRRVFGQHLRTRLLRRRCGHRRA